ncbi:hypothetical protein EDEG_02873 [Edhazardia aedis USNM 41457]|uniref:Uncharacterized protein n=1 Tax=Edhazardia aedis (strain USNM 41457) TaxID=1003232 RepID=J9D5C4_EDHAE|nr:hypothetical protein EDEG_02873 [Edhazardia aedis USNM 41457]|eukprot:EJW02734.1 hypothetical protein EDEG_02873 [Edhazardia aedis USNM 41457]
MYKVINDTEIMIIEQYSNQNHGFLSSAKNENKQQDFKRRNKYFQFHRTSSHDNSECRPNNRNKNLPKQDKAFALKEPNVTPKTIDNQVHIHEKKFNAIIDIGSAYNYISAEKIEF